ncbi:MAG: EamA family transporter [Candidatus Eisenbacteria bacterium]|nr:EamA family transporter [Candidatus Eisenbacteria bacterium]
MSAGPAGASDEVRGTPLPCPSPGGSARSAARGRLLVFGATFLWGTSATLARFVFQRRQIPVLTVVELRLLISVALLAPWLALRRPQSLRVARRDWGYFLILGLCGVAAVQGSYYHSISVLGVGLAILLQYLAPVLIVIYDAIRGKPVHSHTLIAVVAAVAGTALVVGNLDPAAIHARAVDWVIGFGSAFAFAFYVVFSKRGLERYSPETVLVHTFAIAGFFWAVVTPPWRILAAGYDGAAWLMFLALGVFSTLVPFSLFYAGLKRLSASDASIVATLEPVVAVFAAATLLGEWLRPLEWLGAALVLLAAGIASLRVPEALPAHPERG